jgi:hypothetical protein
MIQVFRDIAGIHALFGEWLDPLLRGDWLEQARAVETAAMTEMAPFLPQLAGLHRRIQT